MPTTPDLPPATADRTRPLDTPVLLMVFNRPRVTRRTFEAVRAARPSRLLVVADGPRPHHPEDVALCREVREIVSEVDWECTLETKVAERNLGLEANVELGLDWAFERVDRAIVLEDDCVPHPTFFAYCEELLERYADDPRVWMVAADNKGVDRAMFEGRSYAFSSWASVWGWATWADRWHAHRELFDRDHAGAEDRATLVPRTADAHRVRPALPRPGSLATEAGKRHFTFVSTTVDGDRYGWDHHFWVTVMSEGGLCATPAYNLVENDGYGEDATHTRAAKEPMPAEPMPFPLVHPDAVALDPAVEAELELILLRIDGRLSRMVRRVIRPLWMRALVRRVITRPTVWRLVRRLVAR